MKPKSCIVLPLSSDQSGVPSNGLLQKIIDRMTRIWTRSLTLYQHRPTIYNHNRLSIRTKPQTMCRRASVAADDSISCLVLFITVHVCGLNVAKHNWVDQNWCLCAHFSRRKTASPWSLFALKPESVYRPTSSDEESQRQSPTSTGCVLLSSTGSEKQQHYTNPHTSIQTTAIGKQSKGQAKRK